MARVLRTRVGTESEGQLRCFTLTIFSIKGNRRVFPPCAVSIRSKIDDYYYFFLMKFFDDDSRARIARSDARTFILPSIRIYLGGCENRIEEDARSQSSTCCHTALACLGWIYARPRDKNDSDNTIVLRLPAGVPPSFLIPHGTADFVRSYRRW